MILSRFHNKVSLVLLTVTIISFGCGNADNGDENMVISNEIAKYYKKINCNACLKEERVLLFPYLECKGCSQKTAFYLAENKDYKLVVVLPNKDMAFKEYLHGFRIHVDENNLMRSFKLGAGFPKLLTYDEGIYSYKNIHPDSIAVIIGKSK